MAQELPTLFTKFILTDEEELAGVTFSTEQRMYMQNIIAHAAEEKVRMTFDPANPSAFMQREAELQGTILTLTDLLNKSGEYLETLKDSSYKE